MITKLIILLTLTLFSLTNKVNATEMDTIKIVIPYGPGGGADRIFRILENYGRKRNINFIADYKPGGDSLVGTNHFLTHINNGKTAMITIYSDTEELITNGKITGTKLHMTEHLVFTRVDIAARPDFPADNLDQLIGILKKNPQFPTWVVGSRSTEGYVAAISQKINVPFDEFIVTKFPNLSTGIATVLGGHADLLVVPASSTSQFYPNNKLKLLGTVRTDHKPNSNQQSLEELLGVGKVRTDGFAIFLRGDTDARIIQRWQAIMADFKRDSEVLELLKQNHMTPSNGVKIDLKNIQENTNNRIKAMFDLTYRQTQIAILIYKKALSIKQIADTLKISEGTVKLHTGLLFKKVGVQNRTQLIANLTKFG